MDNDYTSAISQDKDPIEQFLHRRAAAYQAYYDHMPLRQFSLPQGPDMRLYRRLNFGDLAQFSVLDTRQYRSDHPCGDGETPRCDAALDPSKTMTGAEQERWLLSGLDRSQARWNVIAQQVLMAELDHKIGPGEIFTERLLGRVPPRAQPHPQPHREPEDCQPNRHHRRLALHVRQRPQVGLQGPQLTDRGDGVRRYGDHHWRRQ